MSRFRLAAIAPFLLGLGGCNFVVMHPAGDVAKQQADLVTFSTLLMLLIIVPVMVLTVVFAWRFRASNKAAAYDPEWDHSTELELVIWTVPLLIVICLGALTWMGTHLLDPYRSVGRIAENRPVSKETKPLVVDVVGLDWKWLFIYPEEKIATVNVLVAPVDRPITFAITSSTVMNSFYIPALAGQVYAMPGMETKLHAVMNAVGDYRGFSANYSGAGFSNMHFTFKAMNTADYDAWLAEAKRSSKTLDRQTYLALAKPSEGVPVETFGSVEDGLYRKVLNRCVETGKMCLDEMMALDERGSQSLEASLAFLHPVTRQARGAFGSSPAFVASICSLSEARDAGLLPPDMPKPFGAPLVGAGLPHPGIEPISLRHEAAVPLAGERPRI